MYYGVGSPLIPYLDELVQHKAILTYKASRCSVYTLSLPVLRYRYVAECGERCVYTLVHTHTGYNSKYRQWGMEVWGGVCGVLR